MDGNRDGMEADPWATVFDSITCFEDAHCIYSLWEGSPTELLANGRAIHGILGILFPGEGALSAYLIVRLCERFGGIDSDWESFRTRAVIVTEEEIDRFRAVCTRAGVELRNATERRQGGRSSSDSPPDASRAVDT